MSATPSAKYASANCGRSRVICSNARAASATWPVCINSSAAAKVRSGALCGAGSVLCAAPMQAAIDNSTTNRRITIRSS